MLLELPAPPELPDLPDRGLGKVPKDHLLQQNEIGQPLAGKATGPAGLQR
ncbi:hypothetical protein [Salibaculum sp.]|nr:hypothetical protein [Salibaculum sp.]HKL68977.1 hypothetical protein [Salibaculum sp.]